jgi:hypothetical protein
MSSGGRLAGIGGVYKYSSTDSISYRLLTWQYPPETYRLTTDCHTTFSEKILYITMAQIESIVEPDCRGNDIG